MDRQEAPFPDAELLDASITAAPAGAIPTPSEIAARITASDLSPVMRPPVSMGQSITLDPTRGASPSVQLESMRSQKAVSISSLRLEVHDRSGSWNFANTDLPETIARLSEVVGIDEIAAVGASFEVTFDLPEGETAAQHVAARLFNGDGWAPPGFTLTGGSGRLYFQRDDGAVFTAAAEPRLNDPNTRKVWMTSSFEIHVTHLPSAGEMRRDFLQAYEVLLRVGQRVFPNLIGVNPG